MVNVSIIDLNTIRRINKLNAEFYNSMDVKLVDLLRKSDICMEFGEFINSIKRGKAVKSSPNGNIRLITVQNIKKLVIMEEPKNYISGMSHELKVNDLLITITGTVGFVAILIEKLNEFISINQNVASVSVNEGINPYYVAAFLNSKFGSAQFNLNISGGSIKYINIKSLKEFLIPILPDYFQLDIERLVIKAHKKMELADKIYGEAEELLYKYLNIEKSPKSKDNTFEMKSNLIDINRFDAEYYNPNYINLVSDLENSQLGAKTFGDTVLFSSEELDFSKKDYNSIKIKYVSPNDIDKDGEIVKFKEVFDWEIQKTHFKINNKDILFYSLDKIALVPINLDEQLSKSKNFILKSKEDYPEFLFLFFRSQIFKLQLERNKSKYGSTISKNALINTIIPIIPKNTQKEIANKVIEYFKLKKESRDIIEESIHRIEGEIEKCLH